MDRVCKYCSGPMPEGRRKSAKFCSHHCRIQHQVRSASVLWEPVVRTCVTCNSDFKTTDSRKITCSKKCRVIRNNAGRVYKPKPRKPKPPVLHKKCLECGEAFETVNPRKTRCSSKCRNVAKVKTFAATKKRVRQPPEYSPLQLQQANLDMDMFMQNPKTIKGREVMFERASKIIKYWEQRKSEEESVNRRLGSRRRRISVTMI